MRRWVFVVGALLIGAAAALFLQTQALQEQYAADGETRVQTAGQALVGGSFELVSHTGERVTENALKGRYALIYFGFTFCPDICPSSLQIMAAALDQLGSKADQVQPFFISVDPERDTPEQLASYVGLFHPRLIGLTGTTEQVRNAARAYRIYYQKVEEGNDDETYLVDHSSIFYLMDKQGRFLTHFNHGTSASEMAEKIRAHIQ